MYEYYIMCSFSFYNFIIDNLIKYNYYLKFRGPDRTNIYYNKYCFIHNLLNITGSIKEQPFIKNEIICMYNGEIYNYKDYGNYESDGECLIDLYIKYSDNFCKYLKGEFALLLIDLKQNKIILSTDIFATKPLWYSIEDDKFGVSTYQSGLQISNIFKSHIKIPANTTYIYSLDNLNKLDEKRVYCFSLKQYICNYNIWEQSFIEAIKKRAFDTKYPVFVCMSSGYDSGLICAVLNLLKIPYYTYTIIGKENIKIIKERNKINELHSCKDNFILNIDNKLYKEHKEFINKNAEEFKFSVSPKKENYMRLVDDEASIGTSIICKKASLSKHRIYLSGQGADEIISDYSIKGKAIYSNSNFSGIFPSNLEDIFPKNPYDNKCKWYSFYNYTQKSFLTKEEIISGLHGIEGRYPYLDKDVVQSYLNITCDLKNKDYKAPMKYLFEKLNYPYEEEKIGFNLNLKEHAVYFTEKKQIVSHSTNNSYGNTLLSKYNLGDTIKLQKKEFTLLFNIVNKTVKKDKVVLYFNNKLTNNLLKNKRDWVINN